MRYTRDELEQRIELLQEYLGPKVNYTTDEWPKNVVDRLLLLVSVAFNVMFELLASNVGVELK